MRFTSGACDVHAALPITSRTFLKHESKIRVSLWDFTCKFLLNNRIWLFVEEIPVWFRLILFRNFFETVSNRGFKKFRNGSCNYVHDACTEHLWSVDISLNLIFFPSDSEIKSGVIVNRSGPSPCSISPRLLETCLELVQLIRFCSTLNHEISGQCSHYTGALCK